MLPAEEAEFHFFRDVIEVEDDLREEPKEETKYKSKEGEVAIKVREDTDQEEVQTIQEEEPQPKQEESKPKLFKRLFFSPRETHGGSRHEKPAPTHNGRDHEKGEE